MGTNDSPHTQLSNPWLTIARVAWIAVVSLTVVLFAAGLLTGLDQLRTVCTGDACHPEQLRPAQAELNRQLGLTLDFYAWYATIIFAVFGSICFAVGALIFWRRSNDWMALFVSLFLVMIGAGAIPVISSMEFVEPLWAWVGPVIYFLGIGSFPILLALFPDGRFVPRWTRWLVLMWFVYYVTNTLGEPISRSGILSGPPSPIGLGTFLAGGLAQVYRYRRVSTPLQQQQTKWAVLGFAGQLVLLLAVILAITLFPALTLPGLPNLVFDKYASLIAALMPLLFIPVTIAFSMLRYRLWDVDLVIRRTLIYSVLTGTLAVVYLASVVLLQNLSRVVTGQGQSPFVTVLSTLAIAALFGPLRRRVQELIDRRFFRRKYDAQQVLAAFAIKARDEVELDELTAELVRVVEETMRPERVAVWLRPPGERPLPFSAE